MRFRVLGPLQTRAVDGELVHVGAAKQRVLLAVLLLRGNRVVPVDHLRAAVWPDSAPRSAASLLRTYIAGLRRQLGLDDPAGDVGLDTTPGGYLFRVAESDLDLLVFERAAARGEAALAAKDLAVAAYHLQTALGLWRGALLEDVPLEADDAAEATRLAERRLVVREAYVDARLRLGQHREVTAELSQLVAEQPLRERLWAQWMLALYCSGRQAEALHAYRTLREHLVRELGVEPTAALQRLHARILSADPQLDPTPSDPTSAGTIGPVTVAPRAPGPFPPRQLPPAVGAFTGRTAELARLRALATRTEGAGRPTLLAISGVPGIGKSALAVRLAHDLTDAFPDGQLYVDLRGAAAGTAPAPPLTALGRFLRSLGVETRDLTDVDEAATRFRDAVAGRRLLILLDDARDTAQVRPLLPGTPSCAVLITSRNTLTALGGAVHISLGTLTPHEATQLLSRLAGEARITAEPAAAERVTRLCGHLPLALGIAGARLAARPHASLATLATRLSDTHRRLDELQLDDIGVRTSFQISYHQLSTSRTPLDRYAAQTFRLLGLPKSPDLSLPAIARLIDRDETATERAAERLVDAHLLEAPTPGRYRLHDLLRLFAQEQADTLTPTARTRALARLYDWYIHTVEHTGRLLALDGYHTHESPDGTPGEPTPALHTSADAIAWLELERVNLVAAVEQAAQTDGALAATATRLAHALFPFFVKRGYYLDWEHVNQQALAAADRAGDRAAAAVARNDLGVAYGLQGRYREASTNVRAALADYTELGDLAGRARALNHLGVLELRYLGRPAAAVRVLREAEAISRQLEDGRHLVATLGNLGWAWLDAGRCERALVYLREGLARAEALADHTSRAILLGMIGRANARLGQTTPALHAARHGLQAARQAGDRSAEADAELALGEVYAHQDRHTEAVSCYLRSLAVLRELGERDTQATCLRLLGHAQRALGRPTEATSAWRTALEILEHLGMPAADDVRALLADEPDTVDSSVAS